MRTKSAEELQYRRYQTHLRLINKIKPRVLGRSRQGRFCTVYVSCDKTAPARKLNTMLRIKNRLRGGY